MTQTIVWVSVATSAFRRLRAEDAAGATLIAAAVNSLALDAIPADSGRLGGTNMYRLRSGDYRVLYEFDEPAGVVRVMNVGRTPPVT